MFYSYRRKGLGATYTLPSPNINNTLFDRFEKGKNTIKEHIPNVNRVTQPNVDHLVDLTTSIHFIYTSKFAPRYKMYGDCQI